jgi:hypothetical protein
VMDLFFGCGTQQTETFVEGTLARGRACRNKSNRRTLLRSASAARRRNTSGPYVTGGPSAVSPSDAADEPASSDSCRALPLPGVRSVRLHPPSPPADRPSDNTDAATTGATASRMLPAMLRRGAAAARVAARTWDGIAAAVLAAQARGGEKASEAARCMRARDATVDAMLCERAPGRAADEREPVYDVLREWCLDMDGRGCLGNIGTGNISTVWIGWILQIRLSRGRVHLCEGEHMHFAMKRIA